jgi:very-short-patch-repair endonuclease
LGNAISHGKARRLRITMTDAERRLWAILRGRRREGFKFRRQHPIGWYVVDFEGVHDAILQALEAAGRTV